MELDEQTKNMVNLEIDYLLWLDRFLKLNGKEKKKMIKKCYKHNKNILGDKTEVDYII